MTKRQWLRRKRGNAAMTWLLAFILINIPVSLQAQTPGQVVNPSAVFTSCRISGPTSATIRFDWARPANVADTATIHYRVKEFSCNPGNLSQCNKNNVSTNITDKSTTQTVTGIQELRYDALADTAAAGWRGFNIETGHIGAGNAGYSSTHPDTALLFKPTAPAPGDITGLTATRDGSESIALSWDIPTGDFVVSRYWVRRQDRPASGGDWTDWVTNRAPIGLPTTNSWTDDGTAYGGISANRTYRYRVIAETNCSTTSLRINSETPALTLPLPPPTTVPGAPTLSGVSAGITTARLTIEQPADTGGTSLTAINVYYRNSSRSPSQDWPAKGTPSKEFTTLAANDIYDITGLESDSTYDFRATAVNSVGESGYSSSRSGTTTANRPPGDLTVDSIGATAIKLSWTAVPNATEYDIGWRKKVGGTWASARAATVERKVPGLDLNTEYEFRVRSVFGATESEWSDPLVEATTAGTVSGFTTLSRTGSEITLTWDAASSATGYDVQYREGSSGAWSPDPAHRATGTTHTFGSLSPGTAYQFRIRGVFGTDLGGWSTPLDATTPKTVPDPPTIDGAPALVEFTAISLTIGQAANDGGETVTHIHVYYGESPVPDRAWEGDRVDVEREPLPVAADNIYKVGSLASGKTYDFRATSYNGEGVDGEGELSNKVTVTTSVDNRPPADFAAPSADITTSAVKLTWTAIVGATGYDVQQRVGAGGTWMAEERVVGETVTQSGLAPGTEYHFRIRTVFRSPISSSEWSDSLIATTVALSPTAPTSAPDPVRVNASGETSITISWTAVPSDNAGANATSIKEYDVQGSREQDISGPTVWDTTVVATDAAHMGLNPGNLWYYRVRAVNNQDVKGAWSGVESVRTEGGEPAAPVLVASATSDTEIGLSWTAPDSVGAAITGYRLEQSTVPNSTTDSEYKMLYEGERLSYSDTGLTPNTPYTYRVRAVSEAGNGAWALKNATTNMAGVAPAKVTGLTATRTGTTINLGWTKPSGPVTGYRIEVKINGAAWMNQVANTASTATTYAHSGTVSGKRYQYRVSAINAHGTGDPSDIRAVGATTTPKPRPSIPRTFTATRSGDTISLKWTAPATPSGLTGYKIEAKIGAAAWAVQVASTTAITYSHTGVDSTKTHQYRVFAINANGTGPAATAKVDGATKPAVPTSLSATRSGKTINLTWTKPSGTVTGYRIEVKAGGAAWTDQVVNTASTATTYAHTGTVGTTSYQYRVSARNGSALGDPSTAVNVPAESTPVDPEVPGVPREVVAAPRGADIEIRWDAPASDGGTPITGYRLEVREQGQAWLLLDDVGPSTERYTHAGLPAAATREYRVRARNSEGLGPFSKIVTATTNTGAPGAPRDLRGLVRDQSVQLEWREPLNDGGSAVTGYRLEVSVDDGETWILLTERGPDVRIYVHHSLPPGARRVYRIQARNVSGSGSYSNVVRVSTDANPASAPRDLQAEVLGQDVELRWLEPRNDGGGVIRGYRVEISIDSRRWSLVTAVASGLRHTVKGLDPDELRYFRVAAVTEAGAGAWSDVINARPDPTVPDPPSAVSAIAQSSSRISVAWNPPRNTGGRSTPVTGYRVESHSGGEWIVVRPNTRSLETTFVHGGRKPGTEYFYRISAINRIGASAPSRVVSARTYAILPDAPTGLAVKAEGSDRLRLRWSPPGYDGGGAITGYRIEANRDGEWFVLESNTYSTRTDYLHSRLAPAETWSYRISAINRAGTGEPSASESGTTDPIVPDPPHGLRAEADGNVINLRWQAPDYTGGTRLTGYRIEASQDRANWHSLTRNTHSLETTYTHSDRPAASTWYYRVYAINEQGVSRASTMTSATTDAVLPGRPEAVVAMADDHETVTISWQAPRNTGGARVSAYRVDVSEDEGREWETLTFNTGDAQTVYQHGGLEPATVYMYRVFAINRIGTGPASGPATVRTDARVPDPPANLVAEAVAPNQIDLDWSPPEYDGGAEVTGYEVEGSLFPEDGLWDVLATTERSSWSHEELAPGDTWFYRVSATNEAGTSEPSGIASATTDDTADRIERLNTVILPRFASAVSSGIVRSVSDRMDAIAHHRAGYLRIGSLQSVGTGGLAALADGASVSRSFGSRISAWGNIDKTSMSSIKGDDNIRWGGSMLSFFTGSDIELRNGLYAGLSASHSSGSYDVTDYSWNYEVEGRYRTGMTSVTPYVGWMPTENVTAWASGSYSLGEIEVEEGARDIRTSGTSMRTGAGGLIGRLTSSEFGGISLRVEGWLSQLEVEQAVDFKPMMMNLRRVRTALEWNRVNRMNGGHEFTLLANGGLRHDFNENIVNHSGFEFGGGASYTSPSRKMRLTATGRMLITTDADYNEWGIGGGIHIEPSSSGGLAIKAEPSYGSYQSGIDRLWNTGVTALTSERDLATPIAVEYNTSGTKPYLRLTHQNRVAVGTTVKGLSVEGLSGKQPGLALRGMWRFK